MIDGLSSVVPAKRPHECSCEGDDEERLSRHQQRRVNQDPTVTTISITSTPVLENSHLSQCCTEICTTDLRSLCTSEDISRESQGRADEKCSTIALEPRKICYGMICVGCVAFVEGFSLRKEGFLNLFEAPGVSHFDLRRFQDTYLLADNESFSNLAVLDTITANHLNDLQRIGNIRIRVCVDYERLIQNSLLRADLDTVIPVLLTLYGRDSNSAAIGKCLGNARLYLQDPIQVDDNFEYDNPQIFKVSFVNHNSEGLRSQISTPVVQELIPRISMVTEILHSLETAPYLLEIDQDVRIQTPLLRHQRRALGFIVHREGGSVEENYSLWKTLSIGSRMSHEHAISRRRREGHPGDPRGGIIADQMGLGKTLSMISAIIHSLEDARKTRFCKAGLLSSKGTLILVPSAVLIDGWCAEVETHITPGTLKVHKYHGGKKEVDEEKLAEYDIVLTTFATLLADSTKKASPLQKISWWRLVLDEAHVVRNQTAKQFKAVANLTASRKWCLTGTPIQNSLADLSALIQILQIPDLESKLKFQQLILNPLKNMEPDCTKPLKILLQSICLRRPFTILDLKPITYQIQWLKLSSEEHHLYAEILDASLKAIDKALSSKSTTTEVSIILTAILHTRMLCNLGTYMKTTHSCRPDLQMKVSREALSSLQDGDEELSSEAEHIASVSSLEVDELRIGETQVHRHEPYSSISSNSNRKSTKMEALLRNLKTQSSQEKSIVFSSWKTTLDLVESLLEVHNIGYVRIDGTVAGTERFQLISKFDDDPEISVILLTTGTGAVGLNLTAATQVHLLEPQWNPSVEAQAIGRVQRLTQKRAVTVTRYITENTIEQAVVDRQDKKLELVELTLNGLEGSDAELKARLQNLRSLLCR